MGMLHAPLPPDITVTDRLQMVIAEWKGAVGHGLDRLFQDCCDLVGSERHLLPLRLIPVRELDGEHLQRALKRYHFPLLYAVETVGRFEAALVPVMRDNAAPGFLFVYEEELSLKDQVALFAHAVGHLILNDQERLKEHELPLDPESGETHTDRLAELRYLDIASNRNFLDRQVLESFPRLTQLIEPPEESQVALDRATRELEALLRRSGWVNQFVRLRYVYTRGRIIPNSQQRGKRQVVDALLRAEASLPTAIVQAQRPDESLHETIRRARRAAHDLRVPFIFLLTTQQEIFELRRLDEEHYEPYLCRTLPDRSQLLSRWLTLFQLAPGKEASALSYPYEPTQTPRYYQEAAINQAVVATLQARKRLRPPRILLTLATGTGKTQVAFQLLWKLKKTYSVRNVLFLADRGYLLDQALNNTFGPFGDAIKRGLGETDTAHDILFASYQWLTTLESGEERYRVYPSDYFDVIVIDECHRGSADEDSNWRRILEHFSGAVQIGLTATPLATKDVQTNEYFGPAVYTYSLSQGINDGYLAPYNVLRVVIEKEMQRGEARQAADTPLETLDQQIVIQTGSVMRQYTQVIADHLAHYLSLQRDPRQQKTIVFCVDNDHADAMRQALEQACRAWARPGDIVRIVDDDGSEGKRALNQFCTVRERQPVIVTTARLLTTGVDVPTCKNIVLARGVGSLVEFKQIIGRGTRIFEPEKSWFTIIDYAGAVKHFSDPAFDGDPVSVQREILLPQPVAPNTPNTDMDQQRTVPSSPPTPELVEQQNKQEQMEQPAPEEVYGQSKGRVAEAGISNEGYDSSQVSGMSRYHGEVYSVDLQRDDAQPELSVEDMPLQIVEQTGQAQNRGDAQVEAPDHVKQQDGDVEVDSLPELPVIELHHEQPFLPGPERPFTETARARKKPVVTVEKASGTRFVISGEFLYELDASGRRLREGSSTQFAQQALRDLVKTPEDLRSYWINRKERTLLIEQLADAVVGLDALAEALHLPDVDHYDLLLHILFQQPTITRAERVERLRTVHSAFFLQFESHPITQELLDTLLEKYIAGDAPDVSDVELLSVAPLSVRTRMEWAQAFNQTMPKMSLGTALKELQRLLYDV